MMGIVGWKVSKILDRRFSIELIIYGLVIAGASYFALADWKFWAGFVVGTFCTTLMLKVVLAKNAGA